MVQIACVDDDKRMLETIGGITALTYFYVKASKRS